MTSERKSTATRALTLLLAINLFNYIDRYVLASVLPTLKHEFLAGDPNQNGKAGLWTTAFLISYMFTAPIFGWLADRFSRWILIGTSVALWSLASGWSGLATSFGVLLCTRLFVGIGEAGYGPAAPTIIADLYPLKTRGRVLAWFYVAIPVGSALGYGYGGKIADLLSWRWAFYLVVPPGLLLAALCFFLREPRATSEAKGPPPFRDYRGLFRIRSYVLNTAAMTVMTFAIGGFSAWMPDYIFLDRRAEFPPSQNLLGNIDLTFGAITAAAGLLATLCGGWAGDKLRERFAGSYFLVSGMGMLLSVPATIGLIYVRFPWAWLMVFIAVFFLSSIRPVQYCARQRDAARSPRERIRVKHLHHSPPGRCYVSAVNWYGARSLEHERRALGSRGPDGYGRLFVVLGRKISAIRYREDRIDWK
jgi:MFS family permease